MELPTTEMFLWWELWQKRKMAFLQKVSGWFLTAVSTDWESKGKMNFVCLFPLIYYNKRPLSQILCRKNHMENVHMKRFERNGTLHVFNFGQNVFFSTQYKHYTCWCRTGTIIVMHQLSSLRWQCFSVWCKEKLNCGAVVSLVVASSPGS